MKTLNSMVEDFFFHDKIKFNLEVLSFWENGQMCPAWWKNCPFSDCLFWRPSDFDTQRRLWPHSNNTENESFTKPKMASSGYATHLYADLSAVDGIEKS